MKNSLGILVLFPILLSGCAGGFTRPIYTAAAGLGGAAIGGVLTHNKPEGIIAGGLGGLAAGELINYQAEQKRNRVATENYDLGRSDAMKEQYWIIQNRQKEDSYPKNKSASRVSLIPFNRPAITNANGVVTVATTDYLRVED